MVRTLKLCERLTKAVGLHIHGISFNMHRVNEERAEMKMQMFLSSSIYND